LKRTLQRLLIQPLASLLSAGEIGPGTYIRVDLNARRDKLVIRDIGKEALAPAC